MSSAAEDREAALRRLPPAYAAGLRLRDAGFSPEEIADALGMEPESVGPLLAVAEGKLAAVLGGPGEATGR